MYFCVYTTALPPGGPCPTVRVWPQNCAGIACGGEPATKYCCKAGDNIKMLCLDWPPTVVDNCYGISRHLHQRWKVGCHRFTTSCNAQLQTYNIFDVSPVSPTADQSTSLMLHFCNTLPPTSRTWCSHAELRNNLLFLQSRGTAGTGDMAKPLKPINCHHQNYLSSLLRLVGI